MQKSVFARLESYVAPYDFPDDFFLGSESSEIIVRNRPDTLKGWRTIPYDYLDDFRPRESYVAPDDSPDDSEKAENRRPESAERIGAF